MMYALESHEHGYASETNRTYPFFAPEICGILMVV